jgi:type II secretory pathway pseudopilin PulG
MRYGKRLHQKRLRCLTRLIVFTAAILLIASAGAAQEKGTGTVERSPQEFSAYPGLLPEFSQLFQKIEDGVQLPPPRSQSRLLPLLPRSTIFYAAFPNLGDASRQAWAIYQKELQQNPSLRAWSQQGQLSSDDLKMEDSLQKFYELSQYLGDEVVVSGASEHGGKDPALLVVAEVRKLGLKDFLQKTSKELAGKSEPGIRIVDAQELATLRDKADAQQLVILVRPDFVVGALNAATLRSFNAELDRNSREFGSTAFGEHMAQAYQGGGGVAAIGGIDLQKIVGELPRSAVRDEITLQRTGFSDAKYLVWEHKSVAGQGTNQMELSFTGPRRGAASWLASPGPLGSMDFVSPKAILASTLRLKSPAQIWDDIKELSTASNTFAGIEQMEQVMKVSLRNDLLNYLSGEITLELDGVEQTAPKWRVILRVSDPDRVQATLKTLLAELPLRAQQSEEDGITYHTLGIPSGNKIIEIGYAFVDGYLVIASAQEGVAEAVRLHRSGGSLAKSKKFLAALPPGHGSEASAIFYEDPVAMAALNMRRMSPSVADSFSKVAGESSPSVICAYGEESAIREASKSGGADAGVVLIAAAIAIPNVLRARTAANESSAVSTLRTVNTAEIAYSAAYPQAGYARDLARLGPDLQNMHAISAKHAGIIDAVLGNPECTEGAWCTKSGYRFSISAVCKQERCDEFAAVGTPFSSSAGSRSFCSTSDGVVRYRRGTPLLVPVRVSECRTWLPLQ